MTVADAIYRARRLPLSHQIAHFKALAELEKPNSIRRKEFLFALRGLRTKQLKKAIKL